MDNKRITVKELQEEIPNKTVNRIYQVINEFLTLDKDYTRSGSTYLINARGIKKVKSYFKKNGKKHISPNHKK